MKFRPFLIAGLALMLCLGSAPAMGDGPTGHDRIPSAVPARTSPAVNDGRVYAVVQVGSTMVIGGTFTSVTPPGGAATARSRVASFDALTGALRSFSPVLNGNVQDVLPGPTADSVYIAGTFTTINGVKASHIALLDVNTGAPVAGFRATPTNGAVNSITKAGGRLLIGGYFTTAGGASHRGMASISPTTGAIDPFMGIALTEHHNNQRDAAQGAIGVKDMEATPDGTKLVAVGNFRTADGLARDQVVVVNLKGTRAVVDPAWRTRGYENPCRYLVFDSYMRGVAISPDGRYFAISTTGGQIPGSLCDAAARFELGVSGDDVRPTWVNYTGGDTLFSVEITEQAVYVGGHQRWMNNSEGSDFAGQGGVPRAGLAALDLESGLPLAWNPGRLPRGAAAFVIYASPSGLWVGSDTDYIGNYRYKRPKLAYFPLVGGANQPSDSVATLPGRVNLGGPAGSSSNALSSISYDGATASGPSSTDSRGVPWDSVRGAFVAGDQLFYGKTDGYLYQRTYTRSTTGAETRVDPYNDPLWANAKDGVGGVMRGKVPSFYGQIASLTGLFYADDRIYFTRSGDSHLYWRWFNVDSGIVGSQVFTADGGRSWSDTGGLFKDGSWLYVVSRSNGRLQRMTFKGGTPSGPLNVVDSGRDWRAKTVFLGP